MKIAVIGAGIAGAVLAEKLSSDRRVSVTVFDKSRGIGGRMSTRYSKYSQDPQDPQDDSRNHEYDHGAQFFTARSTAFKTFVTKQQLQGSVATWQPKVVTLSKQDKPYSRMWFEPHFVATPRMNSLCKNILKDHNVLRGVQVSSVTPIDSGHQLEDQNGQTYGPFDWVVSTAPAEQTMALLPTSTQALSQVEFEPCFALMVPWQKPLSTWHAAKVKDSSIEWLCFNHLKPGREGSPSLLIHSSGTWAKSHFGDALDEVKSLLLDELRELVQIDHSTDISIHRWRYARTSTPLAEAFWQDEQNNLAACGDWCLGSVVEDAFTSANALADHLLARQ